MPAPAPAGPVAAPTAPGKGQGLPQQATRPAAGTTTGKVWEIADAEAAKPGWDLQGKPFRQQVLRLCELAGINSSTASVQFGKWRAVIGK